MKQRNKGFTVLELLVVMSIILILMSMLMIGLRALSRQGQTSATKTRLQNVQGMVQALDANAGLTNVQGVFTSGYNNPITAPGDVTTANNSTRTTDPTILNTQAVMVQLLRLPDNTASFQKMPQNDMLKLAAAPPILLDGWGNPMIFVPGGGLNTTVGGHAVLIQAPDKKGFWASAGPDGNFQNGDDNVYSFVSSQN